MMNKISSCLKWTWSGGPSPGLCHAMMTEVAPPVASVVRSTSMSRPKGLIDNACLGATMAGCSGVRAFAEDVSAIEGNVVEIEVEGSLVANEASLLVQAALGGAGVLYVLEEFAAPMIATGQLVPLLEAWIPPPSEGFFLYYPSRRQNLASLRALIDFLRANLKAKTASAERKQQTISAKHSRNQPSISKLRT